MINNLLQSRQCFQHLRSMVDVARNLFSRQGTTAYYTLLSLTADLVGPCLLSTTYYQVVRNVHINVYLLTVAPNMTFVTPDTMHLKNWKVAQRRINHPLRHNMIIPLVSIFHVRYLLNLVTRLNEIGCQQWSIDITRL